MAKLVSTLMVLMLLCATGEVSARTFNLGVVPARSAAVDESSSLQGILKEKTRSGWTRVATTFAGTSSFADLTSGRYRFDTLGFVPGKLGDDVVNIKAAVPAANSWLLLLIGSGLVAYQLRRKQKSLPRQRIEPQG
jgi:hypothetical protein